jgi:hypothetical protein
METLILYPLNSMKDLLFKRRMENKERGSKV